MEKMAAFDTRSYVELLDIRNRLSQDIISVKDILRQKSFDEISKHLNDFGFCVVYRGYIFPELDQMRLTTFCRSEHHNSKINNTYSGNPPFHNIIVNVRRNTQTGQIEIMDYIYDDQYSQHPNLNYLMPDNQFKLSNTCKHDICDAILRNEIQVFDRWSAISEEFETNVIHAPIDVYYSDLRFAQPTESIQQGDVLHPQNVIYILCNKFYTYDSEPVPRNLYNRDTSLIVHRWSNPGVVADSRSSGSCPGLPHIYIFVRRILAG